MIIKAQILVITPISGTSSKTGKPYSFHTMSCLDTEATEPELIKVNLDESMVQSVTPAIGKIAPINVNFSRDRFKFLGFVK